MTYKILLLENIHPNAVKYLSGCGYDVELMDTTLPEDELIEKLQGVHAVGVRSATKLTRKVIEAARSLLVIGCFCIGTNQVDLAAAAHRGIPVFNSPFSNSRSVAELIVSLVISLARKIGDFNNQMHAGTWSKTAKGCNEVRGKTIGLVGYGHVGSQISVLAEALGMTVVFYDVVPKMPLGGARACDSLDELLQTADFVSLHVPELPTTKNLMNKAQLQKMKQGAYLLNYSRGSVVDLPALAELLKSGHLRGAAIDVYPGEPKVKQAEFATPLAQCPNTILTPHIGGSTEEAQGLIGNEVGQKFHRFLADACTLGAVNFPELSLERAPNTWRICNAHVNQPGVLRELNRLISEYNIVSQSLRTLDDIGYVIMDVSSPDAVDLKQQIFALDTSYRTRLIDNPQATPTASRPQKAPQ